VFCTSFHSPFLHTFLHGSEPIFLSHSFSCYVPRAPPPINVLALQDAQAEFQAAIDKMEAEKKAWNFGSLLGVIGSAVAVSRLTALYCWRQPRCAALQHHHMLVSAGMSACAMSTGSCAATASSAVWLMASSCTQADRCWSGVLTLVLQQGV
jgi:hypothetical protein